MLRVLIAFTLALCMAPLAFADETTSATATNASDSASASSNVESTAAALANDPANIVDPTQRADNSFIYDTSIEALFDQSSLYNNRIVQVEGEVIGDRVNESIGSRYCWITLASNSEDDNSTISVWMSNELASQIDSYGRYGVVGTQLQVRGTYHQACPEHEGLADIHATLTNVLERGQSTPDTFSIGAFVPGLLAIALGLVLMFLFRMARERMR